MSIYFTEGSSIGFLYKVVGKGTENLSGLKPGVTVEVTGPLGHGYELPQGDFFPVLVAGGTGIASLNFLTRKFSSPGILFFGGKNKKDTVAVGKFRKKGWKIKVSTEDGSQGDKGFVTGPLEKYLSDKKKVNPVLFSCGPHLMLKKVAELAVIYNVEGYVSLEEVMACGVGNCQGCAIRAGGTYKMVCKDGPVFNIKDIEKW